MKKIIVVMGGPSAEHEVSLATGQEILKHLDKTKYLSRSVVITRDKKFYYSNTAVEKLSSDSFLNPSSSDQFNGPIDVALSKEIWEGVDCVLLALHGEFGEDGTFQGFLETLDIPYTGSGVYSSAVGLEKIASKIIFEKYGIVTPPYSIYPTKNISITIDSLAKERGFPCFVKCPQSGSSRLMGKADTKEQLESLIKEFSDHTSEILIESFISGDEYSCPVLEYPDGTVKSLLPVLIKPLNSTFFDYEAKYSDGACEEIVPAPCSEELSTQMQEIAIKAHSVLKCRSISRTDMIVDNGVIYTLETNTLPGFTSTSLVPKSFAATGGTYSELLNILIETKLRGVN